LGCIGVGHLLQWRRGGETRETRRKSDPPPEEGVVGNKRLGNRRCPEKPLDGQVKKSKRERGKQRTGPEVRAEKKNLYTF